MDIEDNERLDLSLSYLEKQDLSDLSVGDLTERIAAMMTDIKRCEAAISARGSTKSAAESLFKF